MTTLDDALQAFGATPEDARAIVASWGPLATGTHSNSVEFVERLLGMVPPGVLFEAIAGWVPLLEAGPLQGSRCVDALRELVIEPNNDARRRELAAEGLLALHPEDGGPSRASPPEQEVWSALVTPAQLQPGRRSKRAAFMAIAQLVGAISAQNADLMRRCLRPLWRAIANAPSNASS